MQDLTERVRRVRLLLATLDEPYLTPRDSIGGLEGHIAGPAPGRRVPCGVCAKTGRVLSASGSRLCPMCDGTLWRRRRKGEDAWDEYTGEPIGDTASRPAHKAPFRLEDDYRKLGAQLEQVERNLGEGSSPSEYAWVHVRRSWDRAGSYQELRDALCALQGHWTQGYSVVQAVWLRRVPVRMIGKAKDVENVAVIWLATQMQGEIRVPVWLLQEEKAGRVESASELHKRGMTAGQIARELGVTRKKVRRLLKAA